MGGRADATAAARTADGYSLERRAEGLACRRTERRDGGLVVLVVSFRHQRNKVETINLRTNHCPSTMASIPYQETEAFWPNLLPDEILLKIIKMVARVSLSYTSHGGSEVPVEYDHDVLIHSVR